MIVPEFDAEERLGGDEDFYFIIVGRVLTHMHFYFAPGIRGRHPWLADAYDEDVYKLNSIKDAYCILRLLKDNVDLKQWSEPTPKAEGIFIARIDKKKTIYKLGVSKDSKEKYV